MNKFYIITKILFHAVNLLLIFFYLYPGSILGWILYDNFESQPQITNDFLNISSNHFYVFFVFSLLGIIAYFNNDKFKLIIKYLFFLTIILECFHLIIPERSFEFKDLFGNILGVTISFIIYKIWKNYE